MTNGWTPERRARQAERIRQTKPWEKSTGPRTETGKQASRLNAWKHGWRSAACNELLAVLRAQRDFVKAVNQMLAEEIRQEREQRRKEKSIL